MSIKQEVLLERYLCEAERKARLARWQAEDAYHDKCDKIRRALANLGKCLEVAGALAAERKAGHYYGKLDAELGLLTKGSEPDASNQAWQDGWSDGWDAAERYFHTGLR